MISAIFQGDFTSFQQAIERTETRLRTFEQNAAKVDTTLAKMGNKFSGVKVIQDAIAMEKAIKDIGGATMLTRQELIDVGTQAQAALDKLKALGREGSQGLKDLAAAGAQARADVASTAEATGAKMTGIGGAFSSLTGLVGGFGLAMAGAFSVGKVINFASEIGSFAGQMVDLSDQTGIAIEDLQALDYVAAGAGLTIEDVTGSVGQLSNRLAGGDKSAAAAMEKLGLSTQALLSQSPDEALIEIAEAVGKIQNPMEKTAIAMDLFGKAGPKMLRLMKGDLDDLIEAAKGTGAVIDEELIRKADDFDDAWDQAVKSVKGYIASIVLSPFKGTSPEAARATLDSIMKRREAGDEGALRVSDEYLSNLADSVLEADKLKLAGALGPAKPGFGTVAAGIQTSIDAAARLGGITAGRTPAEIAAAKQATDDEIARQKRIRDQFGKKPPTAEELERGLFGYTSAERDKWAKEQDDFIAQQFRDAARLKAAKDQFFGGDTSIGGEMPRPTLVQNTAKEAAAIAQMYKGPATATIGTIENTIAPQAATSFSKGFSATLSKTLGPTILAAVTSGGGAKAIGQGMTSAVGSAIGEGLLGKDSTIGKAISKNWTGILGDTLGAALPGIGALAGPALSAAMKGIGKLFGAEGKKTNKDRDAWIEANFGTSDNLRKLAVEAGVTEAALQKVFSTKKVKDFEAASKAVADQINAFNNEQAADQERLNAALTKYGFTFEEIGKKTQQSQLDATAKELIEDWRVLVGSGIEIATVNDRMSDSINAYLTTALKVGAEIPAAMKPILERMAAQGELTDEAGNKITDLKAAGITFSETMTQGFDRVVLKLGELIDKIGGVGSAISSIPDADVAVNYSYNVPPPPSFPSINMPPGFDPSGYAYGGGVPGMPGYNFAQGTGGKYIDFGAGTPAMLHGKERVMTAGEGEGGLAAMAQSITNLQVSMVRAIRENALSVRDQTLLAIGRG